MSKRHDTIFMGVRKLESESNEEWEMFQTFAKLPPGRRSLAAAQGITKSNYRKTLTLVKKHRWNERAREAWESNSDRSTRDKRELIEDQKAIIDKLHELGRNNLERLISESRNGNGDGACLSARDTMNVIDKAIQLQKQLDSEIYPLDVDDYIDYSKLSSEELLKLRELLAKAGRAD